MIEAVAAASTAVTRATYIKRAFCDGCGAEWADLDERWELHRAEDETGLELLLFCPACLAAEFAGE
jgi:hypothetical protein